VIKVQNLFKIFGKHPERALELLKKNYSKDEVKEKTGQVVALNDVSFTVQDGEIFVVMGLSGSGKSTLIRCINRLIEPTKGNIYIDNVDLLAMTKAELINFRREKISMVFQSFALFPFRTVFDNVKFGLEVQGKSKEVIEKKTMQILELVGLEKWKDAFPDELSGGMQQRVGTARALVTDPDILLMDEPFSALDPIIRNHMQDELLELQKELHKTIIFITHDLNEALKVGNRCAILKDGMVVQIGTGSDILRCPVNDLVVDFGRDVNRLNILTAQDVMIDPSAYAIDLETDTPQTALQKMKKYNMFYCFILNENKTLRGMIHLDDVNALIDQNEVSLKRIVVSKVPKENIVSPRTLIKDLYPVMSKSTVPVVVVNSDDKVLGIIDQKSVFEGLTKIER